MKLNDFERYVSSSIVIRGKDYHINGHIVDLEEMDDQYYRAEVEGSEYYEVRVRIGNGGEIKFTSCDCPFDMEAICKHQVAVFMELRMLREEEIGSNRKSKTSKTTLTEQLNTLSKEQLVSLLMEYAKEMKEVKSRLDLFFIKSSGIEDMNQYVKMIRSYVKMHSERGGFVSYQNVPSAVVGAELVLEKAWQAEDNGEYLQAAQISICVMYEMSDLIQSSDDSDGIIGGLIDDCLQLMVKLSKSADSLSPSGRRTLLCTLLQAAQHKVLADWVLSLLEIAAGIVNDKETMQQWEDCVRKLEKREIGQYNDFFVEKVALLKYRLIRHFHGEQSGAQYLQAHMELSDIRETAIREAMSDKRFEEALKYAMEGELQDTKREYPGLVNRWKKLRLEIYKLKGESKLRRQLTEEFAASGEYDYYLQLKELYDGPEEWPDVYARVLAELEKGQSWHADSMYTKLLIEEKETGKLLEYVKRHPETVVDYCKHLVGQYSLEVYQLFEHHIESSMKYSSNRKQYKQVCQIIRKLLGAGGRQQAERITDNLRQRHANRPALLNELDQIDFS